MEGCPGWPDGPVGPAVETEGPPEYPGCECGGPVFCCDPFAPLVEGDPVLSEETFGPDPPEFGAAWLEGSPVVACG